jgi:NADH dehydrogenase FAD-containing subunit
MRKPLASIIPSHLKLIPSAASGFEPGTNEVVLSDGGRIGYDYLVVAAGLSTSEWRYPARLYIAVETFANELMY